MNIIRHFLTVKLSNVSSWACFKLMNSSTHVKPVSSNFCLLRVSPNLLNA
jgi:hypothetical protein